MAVTPHADKIARAGNRKCALPQREAANKSMKAIICAFAETRSRCAFLQPYLIIPAERKIQQCVSLEPSRITNKIFQDQARSTTRSSRTHLQRFDVEESSERIQQTKRPFAAAFISALLLTATLHVVPIQSTHDTLSTSILSIPASIELVQPAYATDDVERGMACVASKSSKQFSSCISDKTCSKGMGCFVKCAAIPQSDAEGSCQVRCMDFYQNELLDQFTDCTLTDNKCYKALQADKRYPPLPANLWDKRLYGGNKDLRAELENLFRGTWYISGGLNPAFDAFDCQRHIFYEPKTSSEEDSSIVVADATFEYRVKTDNTGGYFTKKGDKQLSLVQRTKEDSSGLVLIHRESGVEISLSLRKRL